jgi:hypothetical protein
LRLLSQLRPRIRPQKALEKTCGCVNDGNFIILQLCCSVRKTPDLAEGERRPTSAAALHPEELPRGTLAQAQDDFRRQRQEQVQDDQRPVDRVAGVALGRDDEQFGRDESNPGHAARTGKRYFLPAAAAFFVSGARIRKRLMSSGIDSEESFPAAYVAWWASTTKRAVVLVRARQAGNRFLCSLKGLQIRALGSLYLSIPLESFKTGLFGSSPLP